ncbi:Oxygen-independent coproporphyrinogen-III oxidase 1 [compost metagenome]
MTATLTLPAAMETLAPEDRRVGVYLHIPFCVKKCYYCDFACYAGQDKHIDDYVDALTREIEAYAGLEAETIYFGGGTPSVLSPRQLDAIMTALHRHLRVLPGAETTMEVNPGTGSPELWKTAHDWGIHRMSLGVQTFDAELLKRIGRDHAPEDVPRTLEAIREAGIQNLSLDLMYALPGQTMAAWEASITQALALEPKHFSIYSLILEEQTVFGAWHRKGKLALVDEDLEIAMAETLEARMTSAGFTQYEISSWTQPGFESRHNTRYWINAPFIGLGTGAHSYWLNRRFAHGRGIMDYIRNPLPELPSEPMNEQEIREETVFLGLRMTREGLVKARYAERFGETVEDRYGKTVQQLVSDGLLEDRGDRLLLTPRGIMLSNDVFAAFLD